MAHRKSLLALITTLALTSSIEVQAQATRLPSVDLPESLDRVLRDYEQAWAGGDDARLAELFTSDGFVRASGGWIRGSEAIRAHYRNAGGDLRLRAVAFSTASTTGYIVGAYGYGDAASERDNGVFVLALRRDDPSGVWKIAADLDHGIDGPD